jgi:hypothetical protein
VGGTGAWDRPQGAEIGDPPAGLVREGPHPAAGAADGPDQPLRQDRAQGVRYVEGGGARLIQAADRARPGADVQRAEHGVKDSRKVYLAPPLSR